MKKLIYLLLFVPVGLFAQIKDYGTYVQFQFDRDTVDLPKSKVGAVVVWGDSVSLLPPAQNVFISRDVVSALMVIDPSDFSWTNRYNLRQYLSDIVFDNLTEQMNQATSPDTVFYLYGTDTVSYKRLGYTNDSLTVVYPVNPW